MALVGPLGARKTTLADLIPGINSPTLGVIKLDGGAPVEVRTLMPGDIAYVPQAPGA